MAHRVSWLPGGLGFGAGRIIDTHAHDVPLSRKLPRLFSHLDRALPGEDALRHQSEAAKLSDLIEDMDRAHVTASLVVVDEETDEFLRLAAQHPGRLFGLAYYDSLSPRKGLERVRALHNDRPALILGVSTAMPHFRQDPRLRDFVPLYEYCGERGLPIQFHGEGDLAGEGASHPMAYAVLARTYPRLKVVCGHSGGWRAEALEYLRRFPNLFLQVDGLSLHPLLQRAGSRKLLFGSDWRGREARYFQRIEAVRRLSCWSRRNVGWRTAARVYGPPILLASSCSHPQSPSR